MANAMTAETALRAWFQQLWNDCDETTIDRLFAEDGVVRGLPTPDGQPIRGRAQFHAFYRNLRQALPDLRIEIVHSLAQDDHALAHCRCTATHTGDGLGLPPTGRPIEFSGFALGRFANGQLVEGWNCFDFMGMYAQLGIGLALPAPNS